MAIITGEDVRGRYRVEFERLAGEPGAVPEPVRALRRQGLEQFEAVGFPTLKDEDWRFTNLAPLAGREYERAQPGTSHEVSLEDLAPHLYPGLARLVFVDGFFAPGLSDLGELPAGVHAGGLAEALRDRPDPVLPYLGRAARLDRHRFAALNTAFLTDGALVHLDPGVIAGKPLHLLFVATAPEAPRVNFPRNLIIAGEHSQVVLVESYVSLGAGSPWTCAVTELFAGPGAVVDHYKVQQESFRTGHVALFQIVQERSSNVRSHTVTTGGALVRNDTGVVLAGEGGDCTLNGLYVVGGSQLVDNHMWVDHAAPHCHSYELFKGILDGQARAVFNGRIHVHPGAQKTDAKQSSRNLLLSREALVNANPQLEIFADDVKCTHGSTVGQLDDEAVFYLRSRGIGEEAAKSLLTYAFASDIIERIKVEPVRQELSEFLFTRLPKGEVVRQAV
jgi:Fe-S cluster assembly protein SufD